MNVKIKDLMVERVITAQPHHTVEHVRGLMERNRISAVPVIGADGEAVGIVTATDLVADLKNGTPVSQIMTERVYRVPAYNDVHVAARVMRNHRIHHVVVTHEQEVVGIISSFDLLKLVEDRRFVSKDAPATSPRKGGRRNEA
jgi:CBS domain-containing protein